MRQLICAYESIVRRGKERAGRAQPVEDRLLRGVVKNESLAGLDDELAESASGVTTYLLVSWRSRSCDEQKGEKEEHGGD